MRFKYLRWTESILSHQNDLEKVDQLTVHYENGSIKVYTPKELKVSLIDCIRKSSYLFVIVNYIGGFTTVLYPSLNFID